MAELGTPLALSIRPLDVATPLLQATRVRQQEMEAQQAQFQMRQQELGSEARGLAPYADSPEFGQRWAESFDRQLQRGLIDQQTHSRMRDSPSVVALHSVLARTSTPDQYLKMRELDVSQTADRNFSGAIGGMTGVLPSSPTPGAATGMGASPAVNLPPPGPAVTGPRPGGPVQSSATVVGDAEGERLGIYPPSAGGAPAVPVTPGAPVAVPQRSAGQSVNPASGNLPTLISALAQRGLSPGNRAVGMELLKKELENSKATDHQKDYIYYDIQERSAGRTPKSFEEYNASQRRASVPPPAEKEYDKHMAKVFTEYNQTSINGAQTARSQVASLTRLQQLLSDPSVYTGTGGTFVASVKRMATSLGVDTTKIVDGAANADAISSIGNQFALQLRNPAGGAGMPGALSDKDREFLQSMPPNLGATPDGNKLITDYMIKVSQRSLDVERRRQDYVRRNGRLDEGFFRELAEWSDKTPLFPEGTTPPSAAGASQTPTQAEIAAEIQRRGLSQQ